jgi:transposase
MDVHQKNIVVCVMIGLPDETPTVETRSFPTTTKHLYEMLRWLESKGVTQVAMESTGVYWKPVYNILEGYFGITLANAQRIKNVPGRKTDVSDAEWIAKLCRHGLIEASFIPPADLRELRDLTRLRKKVIGNLTAEKNRIQKVLECSNVKLQTVISDIFGVSGRNLLTRLLEQGYIDEDDIEHRVKGQVKKKVAAIADSIFGTLDDHQIFMIRQSWDHIEYLEKSIQKLDEKIDSYLTKYQEEVELLQTMPGVSKVTAACIIAEIGTDMTQFPTSDHLSSWAGVSPGNHESAGKKKSTATVKGNPHIKTALCEAAWAASRSRKTKLSVKYWKIASRRGKKKALIALARNMLVIIYHMLSDKTKYKEEQQAS